ncbi:hypothetical protein N9112_01975 [bacterium]|nr:hypothetical protein [bacterium]
MLENIQIHQNNMLSINVFLQKGFTFALKPLIIYLSSVYRFPKISPPGHFYSPIPDIKDVCANSSLVFDCSTKELSAIDVAEKNQLAMAEKYISFYDKLPFSGNETDEPRYYFDNEFFSYGDAVSLYSMMRHFKPQRIVEVGSGHSSAEMLDINEAFFAN